jgi:hypothetical protein
MIQRNNCSCRFLWIALLKCSLVQIKVAIIWQLQRVWPFASNFDFRVVGFASSFDVELLLILYQNLMLGLLVLQHDDLLTWRSRRRIKWLLCSKAGGVKDGGWVWVDVVGGGVRNEGDVEDKTDCVCGWKKCVVMFMVKMNVFLVFVMFIFVLK